VLDTAIRELVGGVDLEVGTSAVNFALQALEKQVKVLAQAKYDGTKPELVGRTAAYTAKVADEITRLVQFARGGPDSRNEVQVSAELDKVLAELNDEQFQQFQQWMEQNKQAKDSETI